MSADLGLGIDLHNLLPPETQTRTLRRTCTGTHTRACARAHTHTHKHPCTHIQEPTSDWPFLFATQQEHFKNRAGIKSQFHSPKVKRGGNNQLGLDEFDCLSILATRGSRSTMHLQSDDETNCGELQCSMAGMRYLVMLSLALHLQCFFSFIHDAPHVVSCVHCMRCFFSNPSPPCLFHIATWKQALDFQLQGPNCNSFLQSLQENGSNGTFRSGNLRFKPQMVSQQNHSMRP